MKRYKDALEMAGIYCEDVNVVKNGVSRHGFSLLADPDGNMQPVVYPMEGETEGRFVERAKEVLRMPMPSVPWGNFLTDKEFLLENLYCTVQRKSDEDVLKRDVLNAEAVLRVRVDVGDRNKGSFKMDRRLLAASGFREEDLWEKALENSRRMLRIMSMNALFEEMFGHGIPDDFLWVVTTEDRTDGSAGLLFPEIFEGFCKERGLDCCTVIPSSTEELLIVPGKQKPEDIMDMAAMVREINDSTVDPVLQLDPAVYIYNRSCGLTVAAEA